MYAQLSTRCLACCLNESMSVVDTFWSEALIRFAQNALDKTWDISNAVLSMLTRSV